MYCDRILDFIVFFCQATAEANNLTAVAGAKDMYSKNMEMVRTLFFLTIMIIKDVMMSWCEGQQGAVLVLQNESNLCLYTFWFYIKSLLLSFSH